MLIRSFAELGLDAIFARQRAIDYSSRLVLGKTLKGTAGVQRGLGNPCVGRPVTSESLNGSGEGIVWYPSSISLVS